MAINECQPPTLEEIPTSEVPLVNQNLSFPSRMKRRRREEAISTDISCCMDCCRALCRGLYSCSWRQPSEETEMETVKNRRCARCWSSVVAVVSLLTLCWMYICLIAFNDREEANWKCFTILKQWVNWFMVVTITSAVVTSYCILLLFFSLFQGALKEPLDLHWLHKILLFLSVLFVMLGVIGISHQWRAEWETVFLSFQATAPFLHMGGVGALTLLSWLVIKSFHKACRAGSKVLIMVVFTVVSLALFLCPLFIHSPCLIEVAELPAKPDLIGHRGAPMLAPENTMMSFRRSVGCNVAAFETDVQISKDRVPFLMHDSGSDFLRRTTDVKEKFPEQIFDHSTDLTWEKLQSLNAGDWFVKTDPFRSASQLSSEEKEMSKNQTIPSLLQLLNLARQHSVKVIFDLYGYRQDNNDTADVVGAILRSGIPPQLVLWLPYEDREYVKEAAPEFIQVYHNVSEMDESGGNHLNLRYSKLSAGAIRGLRSRNVTVNLWVVNEPWLFSLLWCSGASSVTTNSCHLLKDMSRPHWTLGPETYRMIWISVDLVSLLIMFALFIFLRRREDTGKETALSQRNMSRHNSNIPILNTSKNGLTVDQEERMLISTVILQ